MRSNQLKPKIEDLVSNNTKKAMERDTDYRTHRQTQLLREAVQPLLARTRPSSERKALVEQRDGSD
tara:strand:+ start:54 stop:251 length:198 start_codon:yes stop_codon:yes gene_type:complete